MSEHKIKVYGQLLEILVKHGFGRMTTEHGLVELDKRLSRQPKKKAQRRELKKAWGLTASGRICTWSIAHTRRSAIQQFEDNIIQPEPQSSAPKLTIKDYPSYKPVKVVIEVLP